MTRRPASFRQNDIVRLIKGTEAAGKQVRGVEYDKGKVTVITGATVKDDQDDQGEWDNAINSIEAHK